VILLGAVKASDLFHVAWVSLVASVAVCILYAFVVLFGSRSAESRRSGHHTASLTYGALTALALAAFAGVVILGVQIMLSKG
jgi:hypothetical protein